MALYHGTKYGAMQLMEGPGNKVDIYINVVVYLSICDCNEKPKLQQQCEDAAHKSKNHQNNRFMGPCKSFGAPEKYPLWACN